MLGQRQPHDLKLTLATVMKDVVDDVQRDVHPEILHHREGFDFIPGNRAVSAVEVRLVNVMSQGTGVEAVSGQRKKTTTMCCWTAARPWVRSSSTVLLPRT